MKKISKSMMAISLSAGIALSGMGTVPYNVMAKDKGSYNAASLSDKSPLLDQGNFDKDHKALSEDTLVIKYKKPFAYKEYSQAGTQLLQVVPELNYAIVKVKDKNKLQNSIQYFQNSKNTLLVKPSAMYTTLGMPDPKAGQQYMHSMLHTSDAQKLAGKNKVIVAVVDQGVDPSHPDIKNLMPSYNAVNPMNQAMPDFHGTHVAGIIGAAKDNGIGGYGINPNVEILPIDVFNRGWGAYDFAIAQGILAAVKKGADVINLSLGGPMTSPIIEEAVQTALSKNVIVVAAAGNTGDDSISYPAAYEGVISVGAINKKKKLADFSSYGPSVDVVAPGEDIYSTLYDYEKKSTFANMSGTSMATPVVTGLVSLMLTKNPKLTPAQVEYILEHTADDLGDKGFDVKYGNGLINPVKAMKYDVKKLPSLVKTKLSLEDKLKRAIDLSGEKETSSKGYFVKAQDEKLYKLEVQKGDKIQLNLNGSKQYDYMMELHLVSEEEERTIKVNNVREGKTEAKYMEAPFSGTLLVSVKDVNGSYDDTSARKSNYTLNVTVGNGAYEDESSLETPVEINALPYNSKETPMYFMGDAENGDDDYFHFKVDEQQMVKINLSGIAGVDSNLSVFTADQLGFGTGDEPKEGEVEKADAAAEKHVIDPMYYQNSGGAGEGETLVFQADPDMDYYVKASNNPNNYFGYYDYFMNPGMEKVEAENSMNSYTLTIDGKVMPEDEDAFPFYGDPGQSETAAKEEMGLKAQRVKMASASEGEELDPEAQFIQMLQDQAPDYMIGNDAEGYLQNQGDEDWLQIGASESGIFEFSINPSSKERPMIQIYKLVQPETDEDNARPYLQQVAENTKWGWSNVEVTPTLYTVLEKGQQYFVRIGADYFSGSIPFDGYTLSSKKLADNIGDSYETNDDFKDAKKLTSDSLTANFSKPFDQDIYYYTAPKDAIMGLTMERGTAAKSLKDKLPAELFSPFYGMAAVLEDVNNNHKLDENENATVQLVDHMTEQGYTFGSIKVEKGKHYFVVVSGYVDSYLPFTLTPYKLHLSPVNEKDEDRGSIVKNNVASKPLKLNKVTGNLYTKEGYLNSGVPYGDEDWYALNVTKDSPVKIKLETGMEVDGVISVYQNGKLIKEADYYAFGDDEVMALSLKKGSYQIKVRDVMGNSTINPYKLKVYFGK
ncbi:S8 family peptidase [Falsibacillus pallidus]|uniref:Subtilase family protein n=1 Tax=Falsibacillus pallidus TaxID=493781 RepID=A0A370G8Q3_9BACI|nr:S8 family serine peptidase [Falsibacillus pallidus]RDI40165.1 subtilase family protein [Falsibacillus pallidus]